MMDAHLRPLRELAEAIFAGMAPPRGDPPEHGTDIPFITVRDIGEGQVGATVPVGLLRIANTASIDRYAVRPNDILVAAKGSTPKIGWVGDCAAGAVASANVLVVRPGPLLLGPALYAILKSETYSRLVAGISRGVTNQISITARDLADLPVPVQPMDVQRRVASLIAESEEAYRHAAEAARLRRDLGVSLAARYLLPPNN